MSRFYIRYIGCYPPMHNHMYLVETVGRAIPYFRNGTDYILYLNIFQVPRRIIRNIYLLSLSRFRILVLPFRQPISRYTAVGLLHIPLGIALSHLSNLGFTDKAGFSLMCYHIRRLFTNRTHVQKHCHLSVYECSRYIIVSQLLLPIDRRLKCQPDWSLPSSPGGGQPAQPTTVETLTLPHGRWREDPLSAYQAAKAKLLLDLPVIIGVALFTSSPTRLAA